MSEETLREIKEDIKEMRKDLHDLKKEFWVFKGKSIGILTFLTTGISFLIDFMKHK